MCNTKTIILILCIRNIVCKGIVKYPSGNNVSLYKGQNFPPKYLRTEDFFPSISELDYYIKSLHRTVTYFYDEVLKYNDTEINRSLGMFFMKAVLKRAIRDHRDTLLETHYSILKEIINKSEFYVSHYVYMVKQTEYVYNNGDIEDRVARVMRDDSAQVYSIGDFNKDHLQKWILSNSSINSYSEEMDDITLTREKYADITGHMDSFYMSVGESDECLSRVVYNPEPIVFSELRPCVPDPFCRKALLSSPSAAYALSHRLLNLLMLRHSRRCYIQSEKEDDDLMDNLCAFMYREAVYISRNGYFARDLFLEHVALCSLFGFEEFFRQQWFHKIASWMDNQGCIYESHNFLINRTRLQIETENDIAKQQRLRKRLKWTLIEECHSHPMALLIIVLAHAIRYILKLLTK